MGTSEVAEVPEKLLDPETGAFADRGQLMSGFDSSHIFCFIVHCTYLLVIHATWT